MRQVAPPSIQLRIQSELKSIPIYVGEGVLKHIGTLFNIDSYSKIAIVTDENVFKHYKKQIENLSDKELKIIIIHSGEKNKNIETVQHIWAELIKQKFDRKSLVICIGGGVVCDVGAFAASTYMRGIKFLQVPTTLLAQTDAAIGGKTGINFNELKNMVGTFSQPIGIICDVNFFSTLPQRDYISGYAEIIKHALIADADLFNYLKAFEPTNTNSDALIEILSKSISVKCSVVMEDMAENGKRKTLNFGHTFGHAIEMASSNTKKALIHGEAIAIGMIAEAKLSELAGLLTRDEFNKTEALIIKFGLPNIVDKSLFPTILTKINSDKKNENNKIKWVLLNAIGSAIYNIEQPKDLIVEALNYVLR